jgi:hypothetical protein
MIGSEYLLWSYGRFEKMTFFPPDPHFKVHMDAAGIQYVYCPVRQVKRCIHIEMLYVTSGDIFYLRLILLNRKAHSDQDVLT